MMRTGMLVVTLIVLSAVVSGCVTYSAGVAPATKPLGPDEYDMIGSAEGTSWGVNVLFIPFCQANTADALQEALKDRAADALITVSVDNRAYYFPLVYLQRIKVEGMAVKEPVRVKQ